jgi:hypothetical protein
VSSLREVKARMRNLFRQERVAVSASLFPDGLLGDECRKTGWMPKQSAIAAITGGVVLAVIDNDRYNSVSP